MRCSSQTTKEKIIEKANVLFAKYGYDGTSIRDIAKEADVNLAAINYHFQNKQNLFLEIIDNNYNHAAISIKKIIQDNQPDIHECIWKIFCFFTKNGPKLINNFKMILSHSIVIPTNHYKEESFIPPGGEDLLPLISKKIEKNISKNKKMWALKCIYSHIIHNVLILNSAVIKDKIIRSGNEKNFMMPAQKKHLFMLIDAILLYLKREN